MFHSHACHLRFATETVDDDLTWFLVDAFTFPNCCEINFLVRLEGADLFARRIPLFKFLCLRKNTHQLLPDQQGTCGWRAQSTLLFVYSTTASET